MVNVSSYYPRNIDVYDPGVEWIDKTSLLGPPDSTWAYTDFLNANQSEQLVLYDFDYDYIIPSDAIIHDISFTYISVLDNLGITEEPVLVSMYIGDLGNGPWSDEFLDYGPNLTVFPTSWELGYGFNWGGVIFYDPTYIQWPDFCLFFRFIEDFGNTIQPAIDAISINIYWEEAPPSATGGSTFRERGGDRGRLLWGVR